MTHEASLQRLHLPERYEAALSEAIAFIHERYQPLGIVVAGTIMRGTPDAASDFDIVVAHEPHWRHRCQRFFRGVPAEMFVNPPFELSRAFARQAASGRPVIPHIVGTGVIVHDSGGVMASLQAEARSFLAAGPHLSADNRTALRYAIATAFEDAEDLRTRDPDRAHGIVIEAVLDAIRLHFRQSGRWQPREKALFSEFDDLDPELATLARQVMRAASLDERLAAARPLIARVTGATGFFEWESPPEPLAPDRNMP